MSNSLSALWLRHLLVSWGPVNSVTVRMQKVGDWHELQPPEAPKVCSLSWLMMCRDKMWMEMIFYLNISNSIVNKQCYPAPKTHYLGQKIDQCHPLSKMCWQWSYIHCHTWNVLSSDENVHYPLPTTNHEVHVSVTKQFFKNELVIHCRNFLYRIPFPALYLTF